MNLRPLLITLPVSLVTAAGFAFFATANAAPEFRAGRELAQAPTPGQSPAPAPAPGVNIDTRDRPAFSPRAMCSEKVARRIGARAYLKARLEIKSEQMSAWNAFEKASDEASAKQTARCSALPTELKMPLSLTDRLTMREEAMKARLESMQTVKPSLFALYATLTTDQKAVVDRGADRHGRGRHGRGHGPR